MSQVETLKADEAVNWFQKRLRNVINYGLSSEEHKLFDIFITSTLAEVDIKKQIINTVLPSFFETLISRKVNKNTIDAQAAILRLFMKYYGKSCSQFKSTIDKFTSKILSNCFKEDNIILKVTKYLALYSQCGSSGMQGIIHAEAWTNQFNDYLNAGNYFLNQLYSNVNFFMEINSSDTYEGKFDISVFNLSELEQMTPKERYEKLTSLFIFFNTAIQSMLLSAFSTVKHFDSNNVIQFALRTLSITSQKLNATMITEDTIALDSVLWKLHCSAIKTISALIKCCGRILIPQGTLICRILLQSLNMTQFDSSNSRYGTTRSKLQQRVLTYQVIRSWQAVAGSQSSLEMFSESLISGILFDIKYDKPTLNLIINKQTGNKKRKSDALDKKIINQRDTIVMHDRHANKTVCNEAHATLQLFLNTLSSSLKPLQFKIFQSTIMSLLLEIISCQKPYDYPLPYYNDFCRHNLYKSLLAIVISPHPQCITQTSVALRIFTSGTTDHNEQIKEVCRTSLSKLEHIIRPRNDTLFVPLENDIEIPQTVQNSLPENQTHFLNENLFNLESVFFNYTTQDSNTDNTKPTIKSPEPSSQTNIGECDGENENTPQDQNVIEENQIISPTIAQISNKLLTMNSIKIDESLNQNTPQDQNVIEENQIISPTIAQISNKLLTMNSIKIDESLNQLNEVEESHASDTLVMLDDFIEDLD